MDLSSYIIPKEFGAQLIIGIQAVLFLVWFVLLLVIGIKKRIMLSHIAKLENISGLRQLINDSYTVEATEGHPIDSASLLSKTNTFFKNFSRGKISESSPLYEHLKAIFTAGYMESQLNIDALIKNTSERLTVSNLWLRSVLSLFIILG